MQVSNDIISVDDWLNDSSIAQGSRQQRKQFLTLFEKANHSKIYDILSEIKYDKLSRTSQGKEKTAKTRPRRKTKKTSQATPLLSFS